MDDSQSRPKRDKYILVKLTAEERRVIKENADRHADGNMSEHVRRTAMAKSEDDGAT